MSVLARSELAASPLADLHAIADQLGIDSFRRLRKAELIDAILARQGVEEPDGAAPEDAAEAEEAIEAEAREDRGRARRRRPRSRRSARGEQSPDQDAEPDEDAEPDAAARSETEERVAEGVVEVLGNGSGFLRVHPPEPSDEDVYISAAQVRRCELVSGDRVTGPVRRPRRSERYPSLLRVDTINGGSAEQVAGAARFEDLPAAWASERLALQASDRTLEAIEWMTPLGLGSRAVIVGARFSGKTATLRRIAQALAGREEIELSVVLLGVRPEEPADWQEAGVEPVTALTFAASADAQGQALDRALDAAKRAAARGAHAVVLLDGLDGLHGHSARRALAAARNLREAGSLTLIATASRPLGGETTVIALDAALAAAGEEPILDLSCSATLRPELLVGQDGAEAIRRARAAAIEAAH